MAIHEKRSNRQHRVLLLHFRIPNRLIHGLQELSVRTHFESEGSNNRGNYKELVYLISKYDKKKKASHLVLRYVTEDCVTKERFIGFNDVNADRSANALSEHVFKCIETKSHDIVYCKEQIDKIRTVLKNKLDNFSIFYDMLGEKYGVDAGIGIQRSKNISIDPQRHYRILYNKIISTVVDQIKARCSSLEEFKFMELLNFNKVDEYCKQFPVDSIDSLKIIYGRFLDVIRLQSELNVMYSMKYFKKRSVSHLMICIYSSDLVEAMPELFNLCKLILTIPSTTASAELSFSALSRIKTYQRNATGERTLSGLALMSIEKDLLQQLMKRDDFYENMIDIFAQKDRRIELI
uniref:HAT C-terminal dimerisation domain-containing protein n=1 Tax=Octopus bimaculoides TaxID=37653 RepID=A0A0L8HV94_OCTBM